MARAIGVLVDDGFPAPTISTPGSKSSLMLKTRGQRQQDSSLHKDGPILQEPLESSGAVPLDMSDISDEVAARRRKRYDEMTP